MNSIWAENRLSATIPPTQSDIEGVFEPQERFHLVKPNHNIILCLPLGILACLASGCVSPLNTRFPQPFIYNQKAEAVSYQYHDPFPDENIGPGVGTRPPSFQTQRDPARRAAENRLLRGYNLEGAPTGSLPPKTSWDYPEAVQTQ